MASEGPILIVDDDSETLAMMTEIIELAGYRVVPARNGREAIQRISVQLPCVILLDLMMPVMSGEEFLEHRRKDVVLAQIPTVVLSAIADVRPNLAGADRVLRKPVDIALLMSTIDRFC
jgi:CheY-like chemotaxis protein